MVNVYLARANRNPADLLAMCGITGIFAFNLVGKFHRIHITQATQSMSARGPDFEEIYLDDCVGLGHRRLCVIDTSAQAHQPLWDDTGRYAIVYNGEIFNYQELRHGLMAAGETFRSQSDTEVLLRLFIREKEACLSKLNGFFAFCVYDKREQTFFLARDRYGVKPLLYVFDDDKFIFASEMKTLLHYGIDKALDLDSLLMFLQLNYIAAPWSIFKHVHKLQPGHFLRVSRQHQQAERWYTLPSEPPAVPPSYDEAATTLAGLVEASVRDRLVSDVPLGAFLSGGIDSSIVAGLARRHKPDLQTFSIGFPGSYFDETNYAERVARHFGTAHTVLAVHGDDMLAHVDDALDYLDEPFADSSALNVYILSRQVRHRVTVALTGDGADEVFGGYNKHEAFFRMQHPGWKERMVIALGPVWKHLPHGRHNAIANRLRQFHRFARAAGLSPADRYWQWATFASHAEAMHLLSDDARTRLAEAPVNRRARLLTGLHDGDINSILRKDMELVLPNDMLTKLDAMSMAHGLELRSPFLDHRVVSFAFSLPGGYKVQHAARKRILRDVFRSFLPAELYNRPKKGFEVPLRQWLQNELRGRTDELLSRDRLAAQGLFDPAAVDGLRKKLASASPGDAHARVWALLVFQWWWSKYIDV